MALWTNNHGLEVWRTDDPQFYYLKASDDVRPLIKPFIELNEIKGQFDGKEGWVISADRFPFINNFLTAFQRVEPASLAPEPRLSTRAYLFEVSDPVYLLLTLLDDDPKLINSHKTIMELKATTYIPADNSGGIPIFKTLDVGAWDKLNLHQERGQVHEKLDVDKMDNLIFRYFANRGPSIILGDIYNRIYDKSDFDQEAQQIYDGKQFIPMEWATTESGLDFIITVPNKLGTVPPYPPAYWKLDNITTRARHMSINISVTFDIKHSSIITTELDVSMGLTEDEIGYEIDDMEYTTLVVHLNEQVAPGYDQFKVVFIDFIAPTWDQISKFLQTSDIKYFQAASEHVLFIKLNEFK